MTPAPTSLADFQKLGNNLTVRSRGHHPEAVHVREARFRETRRIWHASLTATTEASPSYLRICTNGEEGTA